MTDNPLSLVRDTRNNSHRGGLKLLRNPLLFLLQVAQRDVSCGRTMDCFLYFVILSMESSLLRTHRGGEIMES